MPRGGCHLKSLAAGEPGACAVGNTDGSPVLVLSKYGESLCVQPSPRQHLVLPALIHEFLRLPNSCCFLPSSQGLGRGQAIFPGIKIGEWHRGESWESPCAWVAPSSLPPAGGECLNEKGGWRAEGSENGALSLAGVARLATVTAWRCPSSQTPAGSVAPGAGGQDCRVLGVSVMGGSQGMAGKAITGDFPFFPSAAPKHVASALRQNPLPAWKEQPSASYWAHSRL